MDVVDQAQHIHGAGASGYACAACGTHIDAANCRLRTRAIVLHAHDMWLEPGDRISIGPDDLADAFTPMLRVPVPQPLQVAGGLGLPSLWQRAGCARGVVRRRRSRLAALTQCLEHSASGVPPM